MLKNVDADYENDTYTLIMSKTIQYAQQTYRHQNC